AVGGYGYSSSTGRTYIFYNDGSIPTSAASADVIMTGEAVSSFGHTMVSGDFNADSRIDLAVGAHNYSSSTGSAYIFYNDGSYPSDAASADVIITGEASLNHFGYSVASGDFNTDGRTDLAIGAYGYSSVAGRTYIFHNDGSIPTTAASADVIIDGEASSRFGSALAAGDFNVDGKTDLSVGANIYSSNAGRAYIFYSDGSIPTSAASADIIITGEVSSYFGYSMAVGDFNADGKTDLAIGAYGYATNVGRVYIYETRDDFAWQLPSYSTGMRVNNVAGDELKITGESSGGYFGGGTPTAGDFNSDGRVDLAVGAYYANGSGKIYIFYNDGSISNSAALADVIITGEASSRFGVSISPGDFK
ncbi:MAG: FG-GAP-like repeat-containing protein, partial [bacterium]|nr:FG-GAP-like repeat-containing protein [bacterium]